MDRNDALEIQGLIEDARSRVDRRTFIGDVTEPSTGKLDERKIAARFNTLEHAIDDLAVAVEKVADALPDEKSA